MSQILVSAKIPGNFGSLVSHTFAKRPYVKSAAQSVACHVCNRDLADGSLVARVIHGETVLLCDIHLPKE